MAKKDGSKSGGRKKGTPNKDTRILRTVMEEKDVDIPGMILQQLDYMTASDKAYVLLGLMGFLYPKPKPYDMPKDDSDNLNHAKPTVTVIYQNADKQDVDATARWYDQPAAPLLAPPERETDFREEDFDDDASED